MYPTDLPLQPVVRGAQIPKTIIQRNIHTEGHIHGGDTHGGDIHTEGKTHEGDIHIEEITYRNNMHTGRFKHGGIYI